MNKSKLLPLTFAFFFTLILTGCGQKEAVIEAEPLEIPIEVSSTTYTNEIWGFSVEIPEGYQMHDSNGFIITAELTEEAPTPTPEMTIVVKENTDEEIRNEAVVSSEDIVVNGITGKKVTLAYDSEPEGQISCISYKFINEDVSYTFNEWECLKSPIFEEVAESFKVL